MRTLADAGASAPYSLVIPVYRNQENLPELLPALEALNASLDGKLEVVFVVDGSPDSCFALLSEQLPRCRFASQLCLHARNFGSFAAIRTGLAAARGQFFAVMAADLQEPPEMVTEFFRILESEPVDVTLGVRSGRADPALSALASRIFWGLYRRLVQPEMPAGGVDVFGCNRAFRDQLLALGESNSSLVGLILWMGFRRRMVPYERRARTAGKSAWTLRKKFRYLADSMFAFSDLPVRLLMFTGGAGLIVSTFLAAAVVIARLSGYTRVPGYTATILTIAFFGCLNAFGLGVIGSYVWRTFANTQGRPLAITIAHQTFGGSHHERVLPASAGSL